MNVKTSSRARAPNFTREEQALLCEVLKPYMHIIESKKTDCVKHGDKQDAWTKVTEAFNANTKNVQRTTENLLLCYRNMKAKIKKQHSSAKMSLIDPEKKEALINAIEANRNDWNAVAIEMNEPAEICQSEFEIMKKELKKKEIDHKKVIMGTGGGPPPQDTDEPLMKLKKIIEPQVDGLFTIYDGDSQLMAQYQETLPDAEKIKPIEYGEEINNSIEISDEMKAIISTPVMSRVNLLRKKKATPLNSTDGEKAPKKESANAAFTKLAEGKLELVLLQKKIMEKDLQIKELELQNQIEENKHRDRIREKELLLLDLKIKSEMHNK